MNHKSINAKAQGREGAKNRGHLFAPLRLCIFALMSLLCGAAAAQSEPPQAGMIGFPLPENLQVITLDNLGQIEALAQIGYGVPRDVAPMSDGSMIIGSAAGLWQMLPDGAVILIEATLFPLTQVAVNPAGTLIAAGGEDGSIRLYDLTQGALIPMVYADHLYVITALAFNGDGTRLASGDRSGVLRLWEINGENAVILETSSDHQVINDIRFIERGGESIIGYAETEFSRPEHIRIGTTNPDLLEAAGFLPPISGVSLELSDRLSVNHGGAARAYRLDTFAPPSDAVVFTHWANDTPVRASYFGNFEAVSENDGSVTLTRRDGSITRFFGHYREVSALAFSPDGAILFTGGMDRAIRAFDTNTVAEGGALFTWERHSSTIMGLAVSPDGRLLFSGGYDGVIYVWGIR